MLRIQDVNTWCWPVCDDKFSGEVSCPLLSQCLGQLHFLACFHSESVSLWSASLRQGDSLSDCPPWVVTGLSSLLMPARPWARKLCHSLAEEMLLLSLPFLVSHFHLVFGVWEVLTQLISVFENWILKIAYLVILLFHARLWLLQHQNKELRLSVADHRGSQYAVWWSVDWTLLVWQLGGFLFIYLFCYH